MLCSLVREESAADDGVREVVVAGCDGVVGWGMRSQIIHHPRLVLQVRSSSCGRERVSMYVDRRRWWMARLSTRDQGDALVGLEGDGEGVRGDDLEGSA